jgi:mRNA interferase MazF
MARFVSGEVVVVPFPFTDLQSAKVRPAIVIASLSRGDLILCQITSHAGSHPTPVQILQSDFERGGLARLSFASPHRVVTANESCIRRSVGKLKAAKLNDIREAVCATSNRIEPITAPSAGAIRTRFLSNRGRRISASL